MNISCAFVRWILEETIDDTSEDVHDCRVYLESGQSFSIEQLFGIFINTLKFKTLNK